MFTDLLYCSLVAVNFNFLQKLFSVSYFCSFQNFYLFSKMFLLFSYHKIYFFTFHNIWKKILKSMSSNSDRWSICESALLWDTFFGFFSCLKLFLLLYSRHCELKKQWQLKYGLFALLWFSPESSSLPLNLSIMVRSQSFRIFLELSQSHATTLLLLNWSEMWLVLHLTSIPMTIF